MYIHLPSLTHVYVYASLTHTHTHLKHQDLRTSVHVFSSVVQIKHSLSLLLSLFLSLSLIKFIFNSTLKKK